MADAADVQLLPLLHDSALQAVQPPRSHPAPPSPLQSAPHLLQQEEADELAAEETGDKTEEVGGIIHLSKRSLGDVFF